MAKIYTLEITVSDDGDVTIKEYLDKDTIQVSAGVRHILFFTNQEMIDFVNINKPNMVKA
jgi:hypothetical protein